MTMWERFWNLSPNNFQGLWRNYLRVRVKIYMWLRDPECEEVIKRSWVVASTETIQRKINTCGLALCEWGRKDDQEFQKENC